MEETKEEVLKMRNSKTIFMFIVAMSLAVSVSIFVVSSALGQDKPKKGKSGGIIGALGDILEDLEDKDTGKGAEGKEGLEKEEKKEEEKKEEVPEEEFDMPDEPKWEPNFIKIKEEEKEQLDSTTDDEGNTITVYKTRDGVWIKETRDKDGKLIRVEKKKELPNGRKKVEIVDYSTGKRTQEVYDRNGNLVSSLTVDEKKGKRTRSLYVGGIITSSVSIDSQRNITRTTYDGKGRFQKSETKDKNGIDTVKHVDYEKGVTTVTATAPDGSKTQETRDNKTGETLSEVGISADGKLFTYKTGSDADKAFEEAEPISTTKYSSTQDWVKGEERGTSEFRHKDQAEMDRQLEAQMKGGKAVTGEDIIVSSDFKERSKFSRQESQEGKSETDIEHLAMNSEVRAVNPDGRYGVKSVGEPVSAEGYGNTPSEALSNALNSAASTVTTKIKSEFLDQTRQTQKTDGGAETQEDEEDITSTVDASSFAVFKGYEVEAVKADGGGYVVRVRATPGVTVRK